MRFVFKLIFKIIKFINSIGQQEYSKQQAGIAAGITMAVLVPLVLVFTYVAWRILKKRQEENEAEDTNSRMSVDEKK